MSGSERNLKMRILSASTVTEWAFAILGIAVATVFVTMWVLLMLVEIEVLWRRL